MLWLPAAWTFERRGMSLRVGIRLQVNRASEARDLCCASARRIERDLFARHVRSRGASGSMPQVPVSTRYGGSHSFARGTRGVVALGAIAAAWRSGIRASDCVRGCCQYCSGACRGAAARNRPASRAGREPDAIDSPGAHGKPSAFGDRRRRGLMIADWASSRGAAIHSGRNAFREKHRTRRACVDFPGGNLGVERVHFRLISRAARDANRSESTAERRSREFIHQASLCLDARAAYSQFRKWRWRSCCSQERAADQEFVAACEC